MKHLSREELIDSLERTLPAAREAHVDACPTCQAERGSLQEVLHRVSAVKVPEPSPLFWQHFSDRVREQVAQQPRPRHDFWPAWASLSAWNAWSWPKWAVGTATLLVCVTVGWAGWRDHRAHLVDKSGSMLAMRPSASGGLESADTPIDEDWNLVVSMAEDVTVDDADEPGLIVRPGAADRALTDLSSEQRSELARLLTAEMARPAS